MMSINLVVLIFASLIIQDEACTRALRRLKDMRGPSTSQQSPSTPQRGPSTPQRGPSTLQTPPTSQIFPAAQTTISRTNAADFPDDVNFNILGGSNRSPVQKDAITAESFPPLDFASTRDWIPDGPQEETKSATRPLSSILSSRRLDLASKPPNSRANPTYSFYDMAASDEAEPTDSETRSITSALPDLMSLTPGLSSLTSQLPDISNVTPSLRGMTSSLSNITPDVSGMTSTLSNIPNQVTSNLSTLSPTNLMPSTSSMSSIPNLLYLASSLASAFSSWNANNNSTAAYARSPNSADSGSYGLLSYLPGIMTAATSLAPLLSSFGAASQDGSRPNRSPLSSPLSFLPTSLFGYPSSGDNVSPDGYEKDGSNRREKSRYRPKRGANRYNGNTYDPDYELNEYSDERNDYNDRPGAGGADQGYRYNYDYSSPPNGRGGGNSYKTSSSMQKSRGDGNRFQYRYSYNQPQQ